MTVSSAENEGSFSPKHYRPMTLEVLHNLLSSRGWVESATSLQNESNYTLSLSKAQGHERVKDRGRSPNESRSKSPSQILSSAKEIEAATAENLRIFELVTPSFEEALGLRTSTARIAQAEQRTCISNITNQFGTQNRQIEEIRSLMTRMRQAHDLKDKAIDELEAIISKKNMEIRELEIISSEHDSLTRTLRMESDLFDKEVADMRRQLEEREDEETRNRIQLNQAEQEVLRLTNMVSANMVSDETQAHKIQALLTDWHDHSGHLQQLVRRLFADIDTNFDGRLEWNNSEIRTFVRELFYRNGILWPNWQEPVFYAMYRRCDTNHSYSLELQECMQFARSCFEAALALVLTGQSENKADVFAVGDHWAKTHEGVAVSRSAMTYTSGVTVDFMEFAQTFTPVIVANQVHRVRMIRILETGEHLKTTMRTYRECDKDGNGRLTWNNGEIRDFISACFRQHGLVPPDEEQLYYMYNKFDKDHNHYLDMRECLEMVDALFRSTFVMDVPSESHSHRETYQTISSNVLRSSSPVPDYPILRRVVSDSPCRTQLLTPMKDTYGTHRDGVMDNFDVERTFSAKIVENPQGSQIRSHSTQLPVRIVNSTSAPTELIKESPRVQVIVSQSKPELSESAVSRTQSPVSMQRLGSQPVMTMQTLVTPATAAASQSNSFVSNAQNFVTAAPSQSSSFVSNAQNVVTTTRKIVGGGSLQVSPTLTPRSSLTYSGMSGPIRSARPGRR